MKIVFTGAHGVGKTTLVNLLSEQNDFSHYDVVSGVSREIASLNFQINQSPDINSQLLIFNRLMDSALTKPNMFGDRCPLCAWAYSFANYDMYMHPNKEKIKGYMENILWKHKILDVYDFVFYLPIEFDIEDDGVRDIDCQYQKYIDTLIKENKPNNVITITGSVDERLSNILSIIQK